MKNFRSKFNVSNIFSPKMTCVFFLVFVSIITVSGCQAIAKPEKPHITQRMTNELISTETSATGQQTLEPSPFGEISDKSKPNWYGIYPGMSETQSIIRIKNIKGSNYEILKRDKSYEPDNIIDPIDKFYYVDEYIEIHLNDGSYILISISKGYVVLLDINIDKYSINDCIRLLGKPERVSAYFNKRGGLGYHFFNTTSGLVFSGDVSQQQQNNQVKPGYPVSEIFIVAPENFHYIYESYLPGYSDENQRKTMMEDWKDFDSIIIHRE